MIVAHSLRTSPDLTGANGRLCCASAKAETERKSPAISSPVLKSAAFQEYPMSTAMLCEEGLKPPAIEARCENQAIERSRISYISHWSNSILYELFTSRVDKIIMYINRIIKNIISQKAAAAANANSTLVPEATNHTLGENSSC
jgi:hypothetical protein